MMELRYALMDPTGNITALVETPVPVPEQPAVASRIMAAEPTCEQVGFLMEATDCDIAIRMAGGEFCGNAAMCAATLYVMEHELEGETILRVSVSGKMVEVKVCLDGQQYACSVLMPSYQNRRYVDGVPVVVFDGIAHAITGYNLDDAAAEKLVRRLCDTVKTKAMGLMLLDIEKETMRPLVYVPGADTLFWENSCGSGTVAVGVYFSARYGDLTLPLRQPGGTLTVKVRGGFVFLDGSARLIYRNTLPSE